jgi:hypothetical protein
MPRVRLAVFPVPTPQMIRPSARALRLANPLAAAGAERSAGGGHADPEFDTAGGFRAQSQGDEGVAVDHRGVVEPEAVQAQLLGLYGEILHTGVCGDHDACTHQNLQGTEGAGVRQPIGWWFW